MSDQSVARPAGGIRAENRLLGNIYLWMTGGLALSGAVGLFVSGQPALMRVVLGDRLLYFGLFGVELALVWLISRRAMTMSIAAASAAFITFAALNGVTLSVIFLAYTQQQLFNAFFVSSAMFAGMSVYGFSTRRELAGFGGYLVMAIWGIVIASIVNLLLRSSALDYLISLVGIALFLGLTAYETQALKRVQAQAGDMDDATLVRLSVRGALALYLNMINLFLFVLRLFGSGDE